MKSTLIIAAIAIATPAAAEPYLGARVGSTIGAASGGFEDMKPDFAYGLSAGVDTGDYRLEAAVERQSAGISFENFNLTDASIGLYRDYRLSGDWEVFVGGGVDYVWLETMYGLQGDDADGFGGHIGAGLALDRGRGPVWTLGAEYLFGEFEGYELSAPSVYVGVRLP